MAPDRILQASRVDAVRGTVSASALKAQAEAPAVAAAKKAIPTFARPRWWPSKKRVSSPGPTEKTHFAVEKPSHAVELPSYCIDRHEVSVVAYKTCVDAGDCREAPREVSWPRMRRRDRIVFSSLCNVRSVDRIDHPLNCIDWNLADAYCRANAKRLPTPKRSGSTPHAAWSYIATLGATSSRTPRGSTRAATNACAGASTPTWVPRACPSATMVFPTRRRSRASQRALGLYGLYHMAGNVKEWVSDSYAPAQTLRQLRPTSPATSSEAGVVRGGSWFSTTKEELHYTFHESLLPDVRRARSWISLRQSARGLGLTLTGLQPQTDEASRWSRLP